MTRRPINRDTKIRILVGGLKGRAREEAILALLQRPELIARCFQERLRKHRFKEATQ